MTAHRWSNRAAGESLDRQLHTLGASKERRDAALEAWTTLDPRTVPDFVDTAIRLARGALLGGRGVCVRSDHADSEAFSVARNMCQVAALGQFDEDMSRATTSAMAAECDRRQGRAVAA